MHCHANEKPIKLRFNAPLRREPGAHHLVNIQLGTLNALTHTTITIIQKTTHTYAKSYKYTDRDRENKIRYIAYTACMHGKPHCSGTDDSFTCVYTAILTKQALC